VVVGKTFPNVGAGIDARRILVWINKRQKQKTGIYMIKYKGK
jgi:hypothetical protein